MLTVIPVFPAAFIVSSSRKSLAKICCSTLMEIEAQAVLADGRGQQRQQQRQREEAEGRRTNTAHRWYMLS